MAETLTESRQIQAPPPRPKAASLGDFIELIRPQQWIKNVVVFAAPAAALKLSSLHSLRQSFLAFLSFCLAASAAYCLNDLVDRRADANHPIKRNRPVASGRIGVGAAAVTALILGTAAFAFALTTLNQGFTGVLILYLVMNIAYSTALKRRVILDVILVAFGFVLRAIAGAVAVGVPTSEWLMACVFTLCLFMGFGKRRCEIAMIGEGDVAQHRKTLVRYTPDLLNHLITVSAGVAVITFLLYTLDKGSHPSSFPRHHLFYTLPIVVYGIFRFAMLTELGMHTGPTEIVLKDKALLVTIVVWTICAILIAYQNVLLGAKGFGGLLEPL